MLLPEVPAEGADRHQVQALPGRTLHLAEGARLGVGAEAPLLVGGVAPCRVEVIRFHFLFDSNPDLESLKGCNSES